MSPHCSPQGCRVIVPYLRGYGPTRFRDKTTPRSGEQAAIGADLMALTDALQVKRCGLYRLRLGWARRLHRRGAVAEALHRPGVGEQLSDPGHCERHGPVYAGREVALWYQYYFQLERGRAGLAANRRGIAKILWQQWSPNWHFDEECF